LSKKRNFVLLIYLVAASLYLGGVWLHLPGGQLYSDINTVFKERECISSSCTTISVPYLQTFVEYPVIVSMFMYSMGILGNLLFSTFNLGSTLGNYYYLSVIFLSIPTFLLIREILKISEIVSFGCYEKNREDEAAQTRGRVLLFLAATPSFIFMVLINWYIIGVFFTVFGLRKYLEGGRWTSGALIGLSAASNLITAVPALGMVLTAKDWAERATFVLSACSVFAAINLPFLLLNPHLWFAFWQYHYKWNIEGSWMLAFIKPSSPLRHYIFPTIFVVFSAVIIFSFSRSNRNKLFENKQKQKEVWVNTTIRYAWLFTFAFLFSTYVCTPQMNLILIPFFPVASVVRRYEEFLVFDTVNSPIGNAFFFCTFSVLYGATYSYLRLVFLSVEVASIIRSFWIGKMLLFDGFVFPHPLKPPKLWFFKSSSIRTLPS
jgi:hypothetical protein